jgi:hypothetical protein
MQSLQVRKGSWRLRKVFNIKVKKCIEDFLGCKIHEGIGEREEEKE